MIFGKNLGQRDRVIRGIISAVLFVAAFYTQSWILLLFGLFTLFETVMSWCVLYQLMGINTCPLKREDDDTSDGR